MIYTVGGIKGGSGKTTVATNLAVMLHLQKRDVLFVDADDQETATDFTHWRNETLPEGAGYTAIQLANNAVRTEILKLRSKYDDIVIDTGGRDTTSQRAALTVSDVYIVPFIPRSFDMWTLEKVVKLIDEMRTANPDLRAYAVLNKTDFRGSDNVEAKEFLSETDSISLIEPTLGHRKSFANAASKGLSIVEFKPADTKGIKEMTDLFDFLTKNVS
ncbi:MAG: AAA family ATPase [Saprospiraceae bacterium]|nr:AAA family ATPase [Saprospiraceae bacterium]